VVFLFHFSFSVFCTHSYAINPKLGDASKVDQSNHQVRPSVSNKLEVISHRISRKLGNKKIRQFDPLQPAVEDAFSFNTKHKKKGNSATDLNERDSEWLERLEEAAQVEQDQKQMSQFAQSVKLEVNTLDRFFTTTGALFTQFWTPEMKRDPEAHSQFWEDPEGTKWLRVGRDSEMFEEFETMTYPQALKLCQDSRLRLPFREDFLRLRNHFGYDQADELSLEGRIRCEIPTQFSYLSGPTSRLGGRSFWVAEDPTPSKAIHDEKGIDWPSAPDQAALFYPAEGVFAYAYQDEKHWVVCVK
jgi:hypothetical protein